MTAGWRVLWLAPALLALAALAPAVAAAAAPESLSQAVNEVRNQYRIPGIVVVVVNRAGVQQVEARGLTADTALPLGSTSKQFTGLVIQQLIAQGRLTLDSRLDALLPDAKGSAFAAVTVGQLLAHRSGVGGQAGSEWELWPAATTIRYEARRLLAGSPMSAPGSTFEYSNANFTLLGAVIETVTAGSYADALQQSVIAPLGLQHTTADRAQARLHGSAAGHYPWFGGIVAETPQPEWPLTAPSAMVTSTGNDLGLLLRAHLGNPSGVAPAVLDAARQPLGREDEWNEYGSGWRSHAFWQLTDENAGWQDPALPVLYEHVGSTLRTFSFLCFSPDRDLGVAILGDTSFGIDQDAQQVVNDRILHAIVQTRPYPATAEPLIVAAPVIMIVLPLAQAAVLVWCARSRRRLPVILGLVVSAATALLAFWVVPQRTDLSLFSSAFVAAVPDLALSLWTSLALAALFLALIGLRVLRRRRAAEPPGG